MKHYIERYFVEELRTSRVHAHPTRVSGPLRSQAAGPSRSLPVDSFFGLHVHPCQLAHHTGVRRVWIPD